VGGKTPSFVDPTRKVARGGERVNDRPKNITNRGGTILFRNTSKVENLGKRPGTCRLIESLCSRGPRILSQVCVGWVLGVGVGSPPPPPPPPTPPSPPPPHHQPPPPQPPPNPPPPPTTPPPHQTPPPPHNPLQQGGATDTSTCQTRGGGRG